jgi:hypothetical protein
VARHSECLAHRANARLEERLERLEGPETVAFLRVDPDLFEDVVLGLNALFGLDDVGGYRPLEQELRLGGLDGLAECLVEAIAEGLALLLGIGQAFQGPEELLLRVDYLDLDAEFREIPLHLARFPLTHEPVVDEYHLEFAAQRLVGEYGAHRTVDAPRKRAYDLAVADGLDHLFCASPDEPAVIHRISPHSGLEHRLAPSSERVESIQIGPNFCKRKETGNAFLGCGVPRRAFRLCLETPHMPRHCEMRPSAKSKEEGM